MVRLPTSLRNIDSRRVGGCQKPGCLADGTLHRHHKRHEAMWLGIWSGRRRTEVKWKDFIARYWKFLPSDCIIVCPNHHAEIHEIYDGIIEGDKRRVRRPLAKYSWTQAEALMDKLDATCTKWLKKQTPGIDSESFGEIRKRRARR